MDWFSKVNPKTMTEMSIGVFVLVILIVLFIAIYMNTCMVGVSKREGFESALPKVVVPKVGPEPVGLSGTSVEEESGPATLSHAPNGYVAEDAPVLLEDPVSTKASAAQLQALLEDMRAFHGFELNSLVEKGDPNIQMPISTFRGQFQELLDESKALAQNPGINSHVTIGQLGMIRANLTYLQKSYRSFGLPSPSPLPVRASASPKVEGFETKGAEKGAKATLADLNSVRTSIANEIKELKFSGSVDPVVLTRIKLFTNIQTRIDSVIDEVVKGVMNASDIPFYKSDFTDFLPAADSSSDSSSGSGSGSTSNSSLSSILQSLFGTSFTGSTGSSGPSLHISDEVLKGLTFSLNVQYNGSKIASTTHQGSDAADQPLQGFDSNSSASTVDSFQSGGSRGEFDTMIQRFSGGDATDTLGKLDWKERAQTICDRVKSSGLDPADYGCLGEEAQVGPNYSWRGHAKMVCVRLDTNATEGTSQTMGCPPVDWKGWRS